MIPTMKGTDDPIGDSITTESVEKASDDEVSGSNEEMSGSALPASAGMMGSEALPVEGTFENKEDEEDEVERRRQQEKGKDKIQGTFEIGGTSGPSSMDNVTLMTRRLPRQIEGAKGHHIGNESMQRDIREMHELLNQVIEQQICNELNS
ncbi:hypothetical protein Sjap_002432 [Stephania japonica]|uniref:Uncharacterized protein n=1 Tax=Stephania japonica TaxID=461633 RepID=A0AAP0KP24_9MAGN